MNKRCEHCNASLKEWWHTLTPGLVNALFKFVKAVKAKGINEVHLQTEVELTKNEYNNFQKLRFHALVAKVKENKAHKAGYWLVTARAGQFLRREIKVHRKVKTFRNRVIGYSDEMISIDYFREKLGWLETDFDFDIHEGNVITKEPYVENPGQTEREPIQRPLL